MRGRPKKTAYQRQLERDEARRPPALGVIRKIEALGLRVKNINLGRGLKIPGELLAKSLNFGKKISFEDRPVNGKIKRVAVLSGSGISPEDLDIKPLFPKGAEEGMSDTMIGRFISREIAKLDKDKKEKKITPHEYDVAVSVLRGYYDAGLWFRTKHRIAFGTPEARTSKPERIDGETVDFLAARSRKAQEQMFYLADKMTHKRKKQAYGTLVTYVAHDREPKTEYERANLYDSLEALKNIFEKSS